MSSHKLHQEDTVSAILHSQLLRGSFGTKIYSSV